MHFLVGKTLAKIGVKRCIARNSQAKTNYSAVSVSRPDTRNGTYIYQNQRYALLINTGWVKEQKTRKTDSSWFRVQRLNSFRQPLELERVCHAEVPGLSLIEDPRQLASAAVEWSHRAFR